MNSFTAAWLRFLLDISKRRMNELIVFKRKQKTNMKNHKRIEFSV